MNRREVAWAATHDWFISGSSDSLKMDDTVYRPGKVTVRDDKVDGKTLTFTSFPALYIWAGY